MRLLLLFLLTMLCMLGVLHLLRFVMRTVLTKAMPCAALVVPLRGSVSEVREQIKNVKRQLEWSEEDYKPLYLDCGLTCLGRAEAVRILGAEAGQIVLAEHLAKEVQNVCKTSANVL